MEYREQQEQQKNEQSQDEQTITGAPEPAQVVSPDLMYLRTMIVNVGFVGHDDSPDWVLVDTGIGGFAERIVETAEDRFGTHPPQAIILTHGHFDHVGNVMDLASRWDVPVYAHEAELPYLTGESDYPPGDPTVGGGLMARLAPMYPNEGIDLGDRVNPLPADQSVPGMPDWRWIHTPGHCPGHVSLFRDEDRALIAGDAFITVKQESALAVMTQDEEVHGPPAYFTPDWQTAWESVKRLAALKPSLALTGHGVPMAGEALTTQLENLAQDFDRLAIPEQGRYIH